MTVKERINTVRYDAVNVMLLDEFLKEHRKVQELEATVSRQQTNFQAAMAEQRKQNEALAAGLQKVRDVVQLQRALAQTVANG